MSHFDLRVEWADPPSESAAFGPERSTWGRLQILLHGELLTSNHLADSPGEDLPFVMGGMSGLADWIVDAWLPLHWEIHTPFRKVGAPRPSGAPALLPSLRDAVAGWPEFVREGDSVSGNDLGAWQQRHTLGHGNSDLALPSIVLVPEGAWMGVGLDHLPAALSPTVRFSSPGLPGAWPALPIWVPLADVAETLGRFVDDTISRAATDAKTRAWADWLQQRWDAVRVQARQPEVARKWQHGEVVAAQWHMVENRLRDRSSALAEVLLDSTQVQDSDTFAWLVGQLETTPRSSAAVDMEPLDVDWGLPPFTQGYRLAQRTRQVLGLGDRPVRAMQDLFAHFGVTGRAVQARGLFRSAVWTTENGATLVWAEDDARFRGEDPQRFAIAAAMGRLLVNGLKARNHGAAHGDQARWRPTQLANAFAAELLLPIQALERPANLARLSKQYGISQSAAKWHIANRKPDET